MKEQFVTYEIVLKLKELGFDEPCLLYISCNTLWLCNGEDPVDTENDYKPINYKFKKNKDIFHDKISIPLWQQAIDFFIEKYGLHIVITVNPYSEIKEVSGYKIYSEDEDLKCIVNQETQSWSKYKAREQAILKAIELCKNN